MHGTIIQPKRPARPMPIITLMIDDCAGTADIITIRPEAFTISRNEIAAKLRELIVGWIEENAAA
jgi:hypothetical protein